MKRDYEKVKRQNIRIFFRHSPCVCSLWRTTNRFQPVALTQISQISDQVCTRNNSNKVIILINHRK